MENDGRERSFYVIPHSSLPTPSPSVSPVSRPRPLLITQTPQNRRGREIAVGGQPHRAIEQSLHLF